MPTEEQRAKAKRRSELRNCKARPTSHQWQWDFSIGGGICQFCGSTAALKDVQGVYGSE